MSHHANAGLATPDGPNSADEEIIQRFESGKIPCESFHHADHVRLAFAYLRNYPVLQALEKFVSALQHFADRNGKTKLYHETITYAYLFIIHERMARDAATDWEDFARINADLLGWKPSVLRDYYAEGTLESDFARRVFVLPDKNRSRASTLL